MTDFVGNLFDDGCSGLSLEANEMILPHTYVTHLGQSNFEDESSHLRDAGGALLEALQVVPRQHEVPLLPPGEDPVALEG